MRNDEFTTPESAAFDAIAKSESSNWSLDAPFLIPNDEDTEGSVARLLLSGKLESAVNLCIQNDLIVNAILLGIVGGSELLQRAQEAYFQKNANSNLTRLVSAIVMGHWDQLVKTCSLDSWKEALAGALTYSSAEEFSSLCEVLGHRLEQEAKKDANLHAALCYICAGNIPKLVECWSKMTSNSCEPTTLQEIIEQVTVLRQVKNMATQNSHPDLSAKLCHYSNFLAAQGKLSTALLHLQSLSEEGDDVKDLCQRLNGALGIGIKPATVNYRRDSAKGIVNPKPQIPYQQQPLQPQINPYNSVQQPLLTNQRNSRSASWGDVLTPSNFTPAIPAPIVPSNPALPKGPGHLSHKYPAYVPDSSMHGQVPNYGSPYPQPNIDQTPNYSMQPPSSHQASNYPSYGEPPMQYIQPPFPYQPDSNAAPGAPNLMPTHQANFKPGWNDPPQLDQPQHKVKQEFDTPAPITHPLYGGPEPEVNYYGNPNPHPYSTPSEPQPHHSEMYANIQQRQPAEAAASPSPKLIQSKQAKIIPPEHQILNDVFEDLKNKCLDHNNNMQIKRKLDEVSRKLEVLYEKLRENELSANTILGLHQIVQVVQQGDYASALNIHSQLVTTGTFSEISGFMPGLKILLQTAYQLSVRM